MLRTMWNHIPTQLRSVLVLVVGLAVGVFLGFWARGPLSAEWFGAIGTWFGALGTIGAIAYAAWTFGFERRQLENQREQDAEDKQKAEQRQAGLVEFDFSAVGSTGGKAVRILLVISNRTKVSVKIVSFTVDESIDLKPEKLALPQYVDPQVPWKNQCAVPPFDFAEGEAQAQPLPGRHPTLRYEVDGVLWSRQLGEEPVRLSGTGRVLPEA